MNTTMDPLTEISRALRRAGREVDARYHALRLAKHEFYLRCSYKGMSFVTTRKGARKVAHFEHHSYSVWRPFGGGHQLRRIVTRALCGQWIISTQRAEWHLDEPHCKPCLSRLRTLIAEEQQEELDAAEVAA